tara:strand:- start:123 stop:350 length:228 start_codon:yes stop_codon:yes gene_type:complete
MIGPAGRVSISVIRIGRFFKDPIFLVYFTVHTHIFQKKFATFNALVRPPRLKRNSLPLGESTFVFESDSLSLLSV